MRTLIRTGALALTLMTIMFGAVRAQTPTTPAAPTTTAGFGTRIEQIFEVTHVVPPGSTGVTAFTVPAGSALVINDVILTNTGATASCGAGIARGGGTTTGSVTGVLCVPATTSLELPLLTGIDFAEGQTVQLLNTAADGATPAGPISFHLRGLLATGSLGSSR